MGNLVFCSAERPGNPADVAEIPVVRDNDVAIGQGARPTESPEKASAAARHSFTINKQSGIIGKQFHSAVSASVFNIVKITRDLTRNLEVRHRKLSLNEICYHLYKQTVGDC